MEAINHTRFQFFAVFLPGLFALAPFLYFLNYFMSLADVLNEPRGLTALYPFIFLPLVFLFGIAADNIMRLLESRVYKQWKDTDPFLNAVFKNDKQGERKMHPAIGPIHKALVESSSTRWRTGFLAKDNHSPADSLTLQRLFFRLKAAYEEGKTSENGSTYQQDNQLSYFFLRNIALCFFILGVVLLISWIGVRIGWYWRLHYHPLYSSIYLWLPATTCIVAAAVCFRASIRTRRRYITGMLRLIATQIHKINIDQL